MARAISSVSIASRRSLETNKSVQDAYERHIAFKYVNGHLGRLPVVLTRHDRHASSPFFAPLAQLRLESTINKRPLLPAAIGLGGYYVLVILSRYSEPLRPCDADSSPWSLSWASSWSLWSRPWRHSVRPAIRTFEVVLVVLAAVAIDAFVSRRSERPELETHEKNAVEVAPVR